MWTTVTAVVTFTLAAGKARSERALRNPVLITEGHVTFVDGLLAVAVLLGLALDLTLDWLWADPVAGYLIVYHAIRDALEILGRRAPFMPGCLQTAVSIVRGFVGRLCHFRKG